ncbi:MAG: aspartyl/asparaginyl beta-hydroxylase domain-containing protein [Hyphomicrobiales bacterium]|nr:aspartyl/asparaginyl beta-hydroxylase domain-containing protein [Hyphomicrobiales bacterium]
MRKLRPRKIVLAVVLLGVAFYFVPWLAAFYLAAGLLDIMRNEKRDSELFARYFLGNGYVTWLLSPLNLLVDLFSSKNKRIYAIEDFPAETQTEIRNLLQTCESNREAIVAQCDKAFATGRRGMFIYRWFGKQHNIDIPGFNRPDKAIKTIAVSIFDGREATSFHFGPLRLTIRLLYNLTPVKSDGIFIECGNTKHYWHDDPLFIFDDTLMHRSVNEHDARRYCMFVDVVRPSPFTGLIAALVGPVTAVAEPFKHMFYKKWKMLK